jgi:hypothetical protein
VASPAAPARADIRHGRLGRFLHHVAQLAGQRQLALTVDHARLGAQDRAADFGPGQARDQTDFAALVSQGVAELDDTQEVVGVLRVMVME